MDIGEGNRRRKKNDSHKFTVVLHSPLITDADLGNSCKGQWVTATGIDLSSKISWPDGQRRLEFPSFVSEA